MIKFLIYRPISVIMLFVAGLIVSGIATSRLNTSLLPDVAIPEITILVEAPNYSPLEVEAKIIRPMRRYLRPIGGLSDVRSRTSWAAGEIVLEFTYGTNMEKAFIETNEMLDLSMNALPSEITRPRVIKARAEDLPVYYLSLFLSRQEFDSTAFLQMSEYAQEVLRRRLEQLPEVALIDIHGTRSMQMVIQADESLMRTMSIDQNQIQDALNGSNLPFTSLAIRQREYQYTVRIGKPVSTVEDVKDVQLNIPGRRIHIGDIAAVALEEKSGASGYLFNGSPAVSLAVIKSAEASLSGLDEQLQILKDQLSVERPDYTLKITRDQTSLLRVTLNNLRSSLILGCLLSVGIVFFFYSRWQIPAIIGIIIPVSLLLSLLFFRIFGLSLNMMSLSGLLLGLGLMIDNGIIILDNIDQEWKAGKALDTACISGTNEMITPLLTSMLTTISVFLPLIFLSGISGALFIEQAAAIAICLITSYLVSITLLPVLYFLFLKRKVGTRDKNSKLGKILTAFYDWGFTMSLRSPLLWASLALILAGSGYFIVKKLPVQRFPILPEKAFEINIDWNESINTRAATTRLDNIFAPLKVSWQAHLGIDQYLLNNLYKGSLNTASVFVSLPDQLSGEEIRKSIANQIQKYAPGATFEFTKEKNPFEFIFPQRGNFVEIKCFINAPSFSGEEKIFDEIFITMRSWPEVKELAGPDFDKSYTIRPIPDNLITYEVDQAQLIGVLKKELNHHELLSLTSFQYSIPLVIRGNNTDIRSLRQNISVSNKKGIRIPLHQLVTIHETRTLRNIEGASEGAYWPVLVSTDMPERIKTRTQMLKQSTVDANLDVSGAYWDNQKLSKEILLCLLAAVVMLYFLMTAQFESFIQPLIILFEIPISLAGAVFLLWFAGGSINIMSMIGMVVTVGIIINDSIIKVDTINRLHGKGMQLIDAVHLGGIKRINPIVMTTLTTILAVTPFLWGEDMGRMLQRPLAISLIGGMIVGTFVSLFLIPLFNYFIYKNKNQKG